jgi:hypothetical protein
LPTLLYFLFFQPHIFFNSILANRTNGTFGFARHTSRPFAKPKEPLLCHRTDKDNKTVQAKFDLNLRHTFFNNNYIQQQNI